MQFRLTSAISCNCNDPSRSSINRPGHGINPKGGETTSVVPVASLPQILPEFPYIATMSRTAPRAAIPPKTAQTPSEAVEGLLTAFDGFRRM